MDRKNTDIKLVPDLCDLLKPHRRNNNYYDLVINSDDTQATGEEAQILICIKPLHPSS